MEQVLAKEMSNRTYAVTRVYEHALLSKHPRAIYYPDSGAKVVLLVNLLPQCIWDSYVLKKHTVLPKAVAK
jgi:hypothetical protein